METCNPKSIPGLNKTDYCQYVIASNYCQFDAGFFNYYQWEYCYFTERVAPTFFLFIWFLVLLLAVATTADSFFAPCLVIVTKILRMSQNLAGVTLLALGNGAADVFSSLSAVLSVNTPNGDLSFGSILGAGILVNTVTAGIIMIITPFNVMRRPIMKDLFFYFISLIWCLIVLIRRRIELWSSLVFLSIYIVYVLVTAISRLVYVKWKADSKNSNFQNQEVDDINDSLSTVGIDNEKQNGVTNPSYLTDENSLSALSSLPQHSGSANHFTHKEESRKQNNLALIEMRSLSTNKIKSMNHRMIGSFAQYIIQNEYEKKMLELNRIQHEMDIRRRAKSLNELESSTNSRLRHKFCSMNEAPTYSQEELGYNKPEVTHAEKLFEDNISNKDLDYFPGQPYILSNINEILDTHLLEKTEPINFPGMWRHFFLTVFPISLNDWKDLSRFEKVLSIAQSPIMFILTLTIPVVDEGAYLHGWCKILNCLHCLTSPIICICIIKVPLIYFGNSNFALIYLFLIIGFIAALAVALTSKADTPPVYYKLFSFLGFIASIFWIYEIANEIVNVLETFGIILGIPKTVLGISVLAFANSIGDMVSNIMLARKNFPKIAYAACIGGPLFNLLVGIGLPFTIVTVSRPHVDIALHGDKIVLIFTILLVTTMNLIALPLMRFQLKKLYGTILIIIYVVFFILVILFASRTIQVRV